jgi:carbon monoxide dehydrogenase subunit G
MTPRSQEREDARIRRDVPAKIGQQLRAMPAELIKQELAENRRELVRRPSVPQQP